MDETNFIVDIKNVTFWALKVKKNFTDVVFSGEEMTLVLRIIVRIDGRIEAYFLFSLQLSN